MLWRTHLVTGLAAGYLIAGYEPVFLALAGFGSLLPDIDSPRSHLGRKIPLLPALLKGTVGHRGALHSLAAGFGIAVLAGIFGGPRTGLALAAGYLAHLAGDILTNSGVPLFWPLKTKVKLSLFKTGGIVEKVLVFPALLLGLAGLCLIK